MESFDPLNHTPVFTAVLSKIAGKWKPPCPSTSGWIDKMFYDPYKGVLCGNKKEVLRANVGMNLKNICYMKEASP